MEYLYLDFAIHSPTAFELAKWMDDIKDRERIKASKIFKLIFKYEKSYKRPKRGYNEPPHPGLNAYMRPPKPRLK